MWHLGPSAKRVPLAGAIRRVHKAKADSQAHCETPSARLVCARWRACSGEAWQRCLSMHNYSACPKRVLLGRASKKTAT